MCAWVALDGAGVAEDGRTWHTSDRGAGGLLDSLPADVQQVYVVGPRPGGDEHGFRAWSEATGERWSVAPAGHFLHRLTMPVLRYEDTTGRRVEIARAASWYGEDGYAPAEAAEAHGFLRALVAEAFGGAPVLATAATTGRDLWLRTVPDDGWPRLSDEICDLIRSTAGQHRQEVVPHEGDLPNLVEVDGRWMYAALCRELPAGRPVRGMGEVNALALGYKAGQEDHVRGRFRCSWHVPQDWHHVGLLPERHEDVAAGWWYPSTPGSGPHHGWLDGAEVQLARRWDWPVTVHEHLAWPKHHGAGPLDSWARALVNMREHAESVEADRPVVELVRAGVRALLLHGLGAMHGRPHLVTHTASIEDVAAIPATAVGLRAVDGRWTWGEADDNRRWRETAHPEWTAAVWSRERVRMLDGPGVRGQRTGALHVPHGDVVGFGGDALYLTVDPGWADDGREGRLRTKRVHAGPVPAPATRAELLALLREVRG